MSAKLTKKDIAKQQDKMAKKAIKGLDLRQNKIVSKDGQRY
jgi:hypothetical protein